jgi:hypothetical protein
MLRLINVISGRNDGSEKKSKHFEDHKGVQNEEDCKKGFPKKAERAEDGQSI